jgi:16S rRNA (adenine1518-N6/adenine1519-N6)-dimethyltransferase
MKPKKHLGQNFLTSIPARIAIVEAGHILKTDTVLEIGPGKGFLTKGLLDTEASVVALEKDTDLIPILTSEFSHCKNFSLLQGDVLAFDPARHGLQANNYKLIANIPYYITGAIFEHFLTNTNQPSTMVVLIQKEVAERIVARDKKESILSLSVKAYGEPKLVYRVNKGSFNPIPTVDSAVLGIYNISRTNFKNQYHEALFFKVVKAGFAHKRKLLTSNLKDAFPETNFHERFVALGIPEKTRAEDLSLPLWLSLSLSLC